MLSYTPAQSISQKSQYFLIYNVLTKEKNYMTTCLVPRCWECPCNWPWWRMWPRPSDLARGSLSPWPRPEPNLPKTTIKLPRPVCHLKRWPPDRWLWTSREGRTSARLAGCWTGSPMALALGSSLPPRPWTMKASGKTVKQLFGYNLSRRVSETNNFIRVFWHMANCGSGSRRRFKSFPGPKSSDIYWMKKSFTRFCYTYLYYWALKTFRSALGEEKKRISWLRREQSTLENLGRITKMFLVLTIF